jgi:hypothetical protein
MNAIRQESQRALKRMLANGPLTGVPKRPSDQQLLVAMAAARFEPEKPYREADVNETLKGWLETFCDPHGIDHVTLRRMLVDSRLLSRTASGSTYRLNPDRVREMEGVADLEPAKVLADVLSERKTRKRNRAN